MKQEQEEQWVLIFDTDSYAGNFQRAAGEYIMGYANEYAMGDYLEMFNKEFGDLGGPFENLWVIEDTEYGPEVAQIWATPGWFNNGYGHHYPEEWVNDPVKVQEIVDQYLVDVGNLTHYEASKKKRVKKDGISAIQRYPSYQSIAIKLSSKPSDLILKTLVQRIRKFAEIFNSRNTDRPIKLLGIRLERAVTKWSVVKSFSGRIVAGKK